MATPGLLLLMTSMKIPLNMVCYITVCMTVEQKRIASLNLLNFVDWRTGSHILSSQLL